MINLLPKSQVADAALAKIRQRVYAATSVVLVVYVLILVALVGRGVYLSSRETTVSAEVASLTSQVNQQAELEAILRQQDDRIGLIRQALTDRISLADTALALEGQTVTGWEYQPSSAQTVVVTGESASILEGHADSLKDKFSQVEIKKLTRVSSSLWKMELAIVGGEK